MMISRTLSLLFVILLFAGCQKEEFKIDENDAILSDEETTKLVSSAFEKAEDIHENYSQWMVGREQPLDLTIIGPVYEIDSQKNSRGYKMLKALLEQVYESPKVLNLISGVNLKKHFKSVDYIPYRLNTEEHDRFNAVLRHKNHSKEILNDILREYEGARDIPGMSIALKINDDDLQNGYLTLEGYKSIKEPEKERNSFYFTLSKPVSNLNETDITNAVAAVLQLSIPEYVSVDRSKSLKKGKKLRIVQKNSENSYEATTWIYEASTAIESLKSEISAIQAHPIPKLAASNKLRSSAIESIAASSEKNMVVMGKDKTVVVYKGFTQDKSFTAHEGKVTAVDIAGSYIATGGTDATVKVFTTSSTFPTMTYTKHQLAITQVKLIPGTNYVLSGSQGSPSIKDTLKLWDIGTGRTKWEMNYHKGGISALYVSRDGQYALSAGDDKSLALWDLRSFRRVWSQSNAHGELITGLSISDDNRYMLTSSWDKTVQLRYLSNGKTIRTFNDYDKAVTAVAFVDRSKFFVTLDRSKAIRLYDMRDYTMAKSMSNATLNPYKSFALYAGNGLTLDAQGNVATVDLTPLVDSGSVNDLKSDIRKIEDSSEYIDSKSYQRLFTLPLLSTDIDILGKYGYIGFGNAESFTKAQMRQIGERFHLSEMDPVVSVLFFDVYTNIAKTAITKQNGVFILEPQTVFELDDVYFVSDFELEKMGYKKAYYRTGFTTQQSAISSAVSGF
jgi:WD40 repeat protein